MEYVSKTTRVIPDFAAQRKAESTLAHVKRGWLPVNPTVLQEIQSKFQQGEYTENRQALLDDTKEDLALLTHAAKCIRARVDEPAPILNPLRDILDLADEEIERMFFVGPNQISTHKITSCTKLRLNVIRKSILTADTAQILAQEVNDSGIDVDVESAFGAAAFHEVGWNLIAWNYPDLLASARREARKDRDLTAKRLKQILGSSPGQLSAYFASQWLFEPTLRDAVAPRTTAAAAHEIIGGSPAKLLSTLRETAGIFAAIETGEASKEEVKQWDACREELKILAPELTVDRLAKKVVAAAEAKLDRLNHATSTRRIVVMPATRTEVTTGPERSFEANRYLQRCPEEVREVFKPVYDAIQDVGASIEALQSLVASAIPAAGFTGGCIYMLHATKASLVPAVKIGATFRASDSRLRSLMEASALESFNSAAPLHKQELTEEGHMLEHVCAAFGDAQRPGVLLLEVSRNASASTEFDSLVAFKAVRQCLHDCLNMTPPRRDQ